MSTKAIQGKLLSVAPQYWARHYEPWFLPMYKKALKQLALTKRHSLLDAGCGAGLFSNLAIETGAEVIGVDASPGLLEIARCRNPQNSFLEEDLEALPFLDNSFDVVTGFNSFQYTGNFEKVLGEAKRVLKPGGWMVLGIWDKPESSDAAYVLNSIGALLPSYPRRRPDPFALSAEGMIENHFERTDLMPIYKTRVSCPFLYNNLGDGVRGFIGTGPAAAAMNYSNKQTVEETIAEALQPFLIADGFYFLQNHLLLFIGKKM